MKRQFLVILAILMGVCMALLALSGSQGAGAIAAPAEPQQSVLYVAPGGNCGGEAPCYGELQAAVQAAADGDTIKIAQGSYTSQAAQVLYVDKPVNIAGGYSLADWNNALPGVRLTILDAQGADRRGIYINSNSPDTVRLSGLTVQGAVPMEGDLNASGAGIYVEAGQVEIRNFLVQDNDIIEGGRGAGLYVNNGHVALYNNTFFGNHAAGGGAVCVEGGVLTSSGDNYLENTAFWEGAIRVTNGSVTIEGATIEDNLGGNNGGGIGVSGPSTVVIRHSNIQGNTLEADFRSGGGLYINDPVAVVTMTENTIADNHTSLMGSSGGGIQVENGNLWLVENTFEGNSAAGGGALSVGNGQVWLYNNHFQSNSAFFGGTLKLSGGTVVMDGNLVLGSSGGPAQGTGILIDGSSVLASNDVIANSTNPDGEGVCVWNGSLVARHWTLADNGQYGLLATGGSANLTNTIIAGHSGAGLSGGTVTTDTSLFYDTPLQCGGGASCSNNLAGDPLFVNPAAGNFHIQYGSAALDAGLDAGVYNDLDGDMRPYLEAPDIGADEIIALDAPSGSPSQLVYTDTLGNPTAIDIPTSALDEQTFLVLTPGDLAWSPSGWQFAGHTFELDGYQQGLLVPDLAFQHPVTFTISYTDTQTAGLYVPTLSLMYWDEGSESWAPAACGEYTRQPEDRWLSAPVCHTSQFALFGQEDHVLQLPLVLFND